MIGGNTRARQGRQAAEAAAAVPDIAAAAPPPPPTPKEQLATLFGTNFGIHPNTVAEIQSQMFETIEDFVGFDADDFHSFFKTMEKCSAAKDDTKTIWTSPNQREKITLLHFWVQKRIILGAPYAADLFTDDELQVTKDSLHKTDGSTQSKTIDIPSCFSPPIGINTSNKKVAILAKAGVVFWKFSVLALQLAIFIVAFLMDPKAFWFAYLTNWALLFSMVYSALSFANTIFPISTTGATKLSASSVDDSNDGKSSESSVLSTRAAVTSSFFTVAGDTQMAVTLLYWILVHSTGLFDVIILEYRILLHGGVCFLVLVDGLVVNRIPVPLYHWPGICFFPSFIIWTVLQSPLCFDLDNSYAEDLEFDDDKIYP
jgi:hypothetical protein